MINKFVYAMAILFTSNLALANPMHCTLEEYTTDLHGSMSELTSMECDKQSYGISWTTPNDLKEIKCFCSYLTNPSGGNTDITCYFTDNTDTMSSSILTLYPNDRKDQTHRTSQTYRNGNTIKMTGWCSDPQT